MDDVISRRSALGLTKDICIPTKDGSMHRHRCIDPDAIRELPSAQADLITKIQNGIKITDANDVYSCGMRNGMRWCLSLIDGKDRLYENCPSAHPEIIRCHQCRFWDRDTLHHNFNDFRDWNEAECLVLAERDPYDEINRYTEADGFCSKADRREE